MIFRQGRKDSVRPHDGRYLFSWDFEQDDMKTNLYPLIANVPRGFDDLRKIFPELKEVNMPILSNLFVVNRDRYELATEDVDQLFKEDEHVVVDRDAHDRPHRSNADPVGPEDESVVTLRVLVMTEDVAAAKRNGEVSSK